MSSTDWESRELDDASRERLLTEIGMMRQTIEMMPQTFDMNNIEKQESRIVELQLELLAARDFAMGAAAHAGEQRAQSLAQSVQFAAAQARIKFLSKHINRMQSSTTWKLGRIIMLPARIAKRIAKRILRRFS